MDKIEVAEMRESPRGRSMLNLYKQCPRKWAFKYIKGFQPQGKQDPLTLGSSIHEAQALFYNGATLAEVTNFLGDFLEDSPHLLRKAHAMFMAWYDIIGIHDKDNMIPLAVEVEAPLKLHNGYTMTVRWDRVLLERNGGEIFINDTKTTGGSLLKTIQNYNYSDQPKLYIASVLQSQPEWLKQFRGWRTDCIRGFESKGKYTTGNITTEVKRSEIVSFTPEEIEDTLIGYSVLTDDIKFKVQSVIEGGEPIRAHFYDTSDFCLSFGRVCPFKTICHQIDHIEEPPANMEIDPWVKKGTVINTFLEDGK